jgi:hypothetical protein
VKTAWRYGHGSDANRSAPACGPAQHFGWRRIALICAQFVLASVVFTGSAHAQGTALKWGKADASGLAAWRLVAEEMPDLAAEAKKIRFNPARDLRQASFDLDGDGRSEVFVSATIDSFCGSAGCMTFVLTRRADGKWKVVCQTYAHYGVSGGDIRIGLADVSGWKAFSATSQVTWEKGADGELSCKESQLRRR